MSSAANALGLPPGVRFDPTPEELVEFYLMPRALGQPTAVPGIVIEDAEATTSSRHPWKLLTRNRRTDDDEAYFFERIATSGDDAKGGAAARQDRSCGGGRWTWVGQKRFPDEVLPLRGEGEQVSWGKYSLNLQEGRRKGGSTGWVMHEYTITSPQCPCPVKLCHVAFTGHGQKRQRVPDDDDGVGEDQELEAGTPQHKRVATATASTPASSVITMATPDHGLGEARAQNQQQTTSSVGNFWGSDAGFSQESSIRFSQESSITILDPWYPDAGTSHQEPFLLDKGLAQNQEYFSNQPQAYHHQEQFVNQGVPSAEAFCAMLLASGLGSSNPGQEPPSGQPLTKEEQLRLQLDQLFRGIGTPHCLPIQPVTVSDDAGYHEEHEHIQTTASAATADLPLPMDRESCTTEQSHGDMDDLPEFFKGWSDLDTFTDTSGVQDYDDGTAAGTLAGDCPGDGTCYDGGSGNFAVTA
ncbi:unnamed protein product [Miscanthus lutarioriparius]|uniref:NAC domain-containing protein n=1 Tax=Miscanthus lutarioriparius TaxID=422564 RepID=A0A811NA67_9POAL|nr:unnamed protein product [Miscanthus lutarioriparius]